MKVYMRGIGREDLDWIYVAQDRDHWRSLVKQRLINIPFRKGRGIP